MVVDHLAARNEASTIIVAVIVIFALILLVIWRIGRSSSSRGISTSRQGVIGSPMPSSYTSPVERASSSRSSLTGKMAEMSSSSTNISRSSGKPSGSKQSGLSSSRNASAATKGQSSKPASAKSTKRKPGSRAKKPR